METITVNLTGKRRRVTWNGRAYIVSPASLIVPGVLPGSQGEVLYTLEELARNPNAWNGIPIVVNHPKNADGKFISARDPDVLEKYGVGNVYRSRVEESLAAEAWFDVEAARRVDNRVLTMLESDKVLELSTGLELERHPAPAGAVHNGKNGPREYKFVGRNYVPDHLAVFVDGQRGACSASDGCGILTNEGADMTVSANEEEKKSVWRRVGELLGLTANQPSHADLRMQLTKLIGERYGGGYGPEHGCHVMDVFDSHVVYALGEKMWKVGYKTDLRAGKVMLAEEPPQEVRRETVYKPTANADVRLTGQVESEVVTALADVQLEQSPGPPVLPDSTAPTTQTSNQDGSQTGPSSTSGGPQVATVTLSADQRKQIVSALVANCDCPQGMPWKGKDEATLNAMGDETLQAMDEVRKAVAASQTPPATVPVVNATQTPPATAVVATPPPPPAKPKTMDEWLQLAPPEAKAVWNSVAEQHRQDHAALIEQLVANTAEAGREAARKVYEKLQPEDLKALAAGLPQQQPPPPPAVNHYFGAAGAFVPSQAHKQKPLGLPVYNFVGKN